MAMRRPTYTTLEPPKRGRRKKQPIVKRCPDCGAKINTVLCVACEMEKRNKAKKQCHTTER